MLESSPTFPTPSYSHIVQSYEGTTSVAPQSNYIIDIVLELKVELVKLRLKLRRSENNYL